MADEQELIILLVEDTEEHAVLIKRALEGGQLNYRLFAVETGEDALDFLYHRGDFADAGKSPPPDIILLDLRLPGIQGIDVLKQIKGDEKLKDIPVSVLTVSGQEEDIARTFNEGAGSYIMKTVTIFLPSAEKHNILDTIVSLTGK